MNFLKRLSIRTQLLILAISTGIIVISLIFIIYFQVTKVITKNNEVYASDMSFQIKQSISKNCDLMDHILTVTAYNGVVQSYLMQENDYKKVELFKQVNSLLLSMQEMNDGIIDFVFLGNNGNSYFLKGDQAYIRELITKIPQDALNYYTEKVVLTYNDQKRSCFMVISTVYSIDSEKNNGERIGTAAVVFDANVIGLETNKKYTNSTNRFYLLDRNNIVYSGNDPSKLNKKLDILGNIQNIPDGSREVKIDGERYTVTKDNLPGIDGNIISMIPYKSLFNDLSWIRQLVVIVLIFSGVLLSILFLVIINNILHPLKKFIRFINFVKTSNLKGLKGRIALDGYEEIGIMAGEFNNMLDEIDTLTRRLVNTSSRLYETELEKKQSELAFLKSQINPHFLYNTLESMRGVAGDEGALKTMNMARALGHIFRYCVKGADLVTIREELDIIKSYIQIQQIRFNGRFDVIIDFSEDTLECRMPKMLLQPIVENAVSHGLEEKLDKGYLQISGKFENSCNLRICVKDDGAGIDKDALEDIRRRLSETRGYKCAEADDSSSIGLLNVHNRIGLIYGPEYGIEVNSILGKGTEVVLKIPGRDDHVQGNDCR